jgi:hypothetical protein
MVALEISFRGTGKFKQRNTSRTTNKVLSRTKTLKTVILRLIITYQKKSDWHAICRLLGEFLH